MESIRQTVEGAKAGRGPGRGGAVGVIRSEGLLGVLGGCTKLREAIIQARIGDHRFMALPGEAPPPDSSKWMISRAMSAMMQQIKRDYKPRIVILDLPP